MEREEAGRPRKKLKPAESEQAAGAASGANTREEPEENTSFECPVCYEPFMDEIYTCPVNDHPLCAECYEKLEKKNECPTCRAQGVFSRAPFVERTASALRMKCGFPNCNVVETRETITNHRQRCLKCPLKCPMNNCTWSGVQRIDFLDHLCSGHKAGGILDALESGEEDRVVFEWDLDNPNDRQHIQWVLPMSVARESFVAYIYPDTQHNDMMWIAVLRVGVSRNCEYELSLGCLADKTKSMTLKGGRILGIQDSNWHNACMGGTAALLVTKANMLQMCANPMKVKHGVRSLKGLNNLRLTFNIKQLRDD